MSLDGAHTYEDYILIAGFYFDNHLCNLNEVFSRLPAHGLKLNAGKFAFFQPKVNYLGNEINPDGIKPIQANLQLKNCEI